MLRGIKHHDFIASKVNMSINSEHRHIRGDSFKFHLSILIKYILIMVLFSLLWICDHFKCHQQESLKKQNTDLDETLKYICIGYDTRRNNLSVISS